MTPHTHTPRHGRRTLLATVGSAAAVAAAGCLATGDESDTGGQSGGSSAGETGLPAAETGRHGVTAHDEDIRSFMYQPPDPDDQSAMTPPPESLPRRVRNALEPFNERTRPVLEAGPTRTHDTNVTST